MTDAPSTETYTPCFDWVVQATGDSSTALAYGVIWRYAQMRAARCYASYQRLSSELGWSRQRLMRHLQALLALELITCTNPKAHGVTRTYIPVSRQRWLAAQAPLSQGRPPRRAGEGEGAAPPTSDESSPVSEPDHPSHETSTQPVMFHDPNNTNRNTTKTPSRPSSSLPKNQLQTLRKLTGASPPAALRARIQRALGSQPDQARLRACYEEWCARGYNPRSWAWLLEWYAQNAIPPQGGGSVASAYPSTATANDFARWRQYQQAVQEGEDPDEARSRLHL